MMTTAMTFLSPWNVLGLNAYVIFVHTDLTSQKWPVPYLRYMEWNFLKKVILQFILHFCFLSYFFCFVDVYYNKIFLFI